MSPFGCFGVVDSTKMVCVTGSRTVRVVEAGGPALVEPCEDAQPASSAAAASNRANRIHGTLARRHQRLINPAMRMSSARTVAEALVAGDADAVVEQLAPDAVFHSPVRDYHGRERVAGVLTLVARVLGRGEVTRVMEGEREVAAFFTTQVEGRALDGVFKVDDSCRDLTLMARPLSVLTVAIEQLRREAQP